MASLPTEHPSLGSPSWPQLTITSKSRRGRVSGQLVYVLCVWARGDACRAGCGVRVCAWARGDAAQPRSPAHMYCTRALSLTRALSRIAADALARIGSGGSQVHSLVGSGVSQVGAQVLGPRCLASRVAGQVRVKCSEVCHVEVSPDHF